MNRIVSIAALAFLLMSCRTVGTGDPVVVQAENVREIAASTFGALWTIEKENRLYLWSVSHEIKHYADKTRAGAPVWIATLTSAIKSYKATKSEVTTELVASAQKVLGDETLAAQKQITNINGLLSKAALPK